MRSNEGVGGTGGQPAAAASGSGQPEPDRILAWRELRPTHKKKRQASPTQVEHGL